MIDPQEFEGILDIATRQLNSEVSSGALRYDPDGFAQRVMEVVKEAAAGRGVTVEPTFHPHAFPDIHVNGFGIEVKATNQPSWLSVGNSIFEGMRDSRAQHIYVVFGKFGGLPAVRWGRYDSVVTHVRVSHAPRFVIEMPPDQSHPPLFPGMEIEYSAFAGLSPDDKMRHVRAYTRKRLGPGEAIWWLDQKPATDESPFPAATQTYWSLPRDLKNKYRAEAAILCPEIVGSSRSSGKYDRAALYMLTRYNVVCANVRDAYSAGSAAGPARGGNYLMRALRRIEPEMREAAATLPAQTVEAYWDIDVSPERRIAWWLEVADRHARGWKPSLELFRADGT